MEAKRLCEEQQHAQLINITNRKGHLTVSSREIAENFEKRHDHILRDIENLLTEDNPNLGSAYFIEGRYINSNNRVFKEYLLTRDGFSLLVMGFTGEKALAWKLKYIEAFNKMEEGLKKYSSKVLTPREQLKLYLEAMEEQDRKIQGVEDKVVDLESNMPLFNIECKELQALVKRAGVKILGGKNTPAYKSNSVRQKVYIDIQQQLKREFGVSRYEAIKRCQLRLARDIVNGYKAPLIIKNQIDDLNNQLDNSFPLVRIPTDDFKTSDKGIGEIYSQSYI